MPKFNVTLMLGAAPFTGVLDTDGGTYTPTGCTAVPYQLQTQNGVGPYWQFHIGMSEHECSKYPVGPYTMIINREFTSPLIWLGVVVGGDPQVGTWTADAE